MIQSGFFNSMNGDRKYDASKFAEYFSSFIGNGVFPDSLQVVSNNNMTVTVKAGKAWINGYIIINDADYILNISAADGVLNRIDRIVARYDVVDREIRLEVKKGAFAGSPVAPVLQRDTDAYELCLANITVSAGVISITQDKILDTRFDVNLCGKVDTLIAGDFLSLSEEVENVRQQIGILADDVADDIGNKLNKDGNGKDVVVTFTEAATEADIASGEKLSIIFGKILKKLKNLAPKNHSSSGASYGLGTELQYGHVALQNSLNQVSFQQGLALSGNMGYLLDQKIDNKSFKLLKSISVTTVTPGVQIPLNIDLKDYDLVYFILEGTVTVSLTGTTSRSISYYIDELKCLAILTLPAPITNAVYSVKGSAMCTRGYNQISPSYGTNRIEFDWGSLVQSSVLGKLTISGSTSITGTANLMLNIYGMQK